MPLAHGVYPYEICIPSKRRTANMARMLSFFPFAHVYVDILEKDDYLKVVPADQLYFHPSLKNQWEIWKLIMEKETAECVMLCDDDLEFVQVQTDMHPFRRRYHDQDNLVRLVENGVAILCDLQLGLYGWSMMAHPGGFNPTCPIALTGALTSAIIVRGRELVIDTYTLCCDLDLTLQTLLKHRVLIKDMRYYWNFGVAGSGEGGCQTTDTMEMMADSRQRMESKWGKYVCVGPLTLTARCNGNNESGPAENFGVNVNRKSSLVQK